MISDREYALIKRYFSNNEIKAQNAVIQKSKADLDKIVRTQREKENPVKPAAPANTPPALQPSPVKPSDDLPKIIKPSQVKPNRITDAGTGEYKTETRTKASDYAKEIDWREEIDKQVYEDIENGWKPGGKENNSTTYSQSATRPTPIPTPSAPTPEPTPGTSIRPYGVKPAADDYLSNLYDIDEVVDTEYKDQYFGLSSKFIENQIEQRGWNLANFKEEEIDLAGRYPLKTLLGYENMKTAVNMEGYIADKHNLSNEDNTKVNAWKHAYLAALHKEAFGTDIATKFVNAHENTMSNLDIYRDRAVMDLHNNAVGLSINRPMGMGDEEFADYVYEIIEEDGYWIMPEEESHIPDWAKKDVKD